MKPADKKSRRRPRRVALGVFGPAPLNRCASCGRFVGQAFTGYTNDKLSKRGPLFCDPCVLKNEAPPCR